ncbi:MAG TPA: ABC transporter ATP-binding protein [Candidatus Dormibacteraeota bacterium]|jgi:ABC-type multidrug transport system fused ATPase/permease subunit|nr:ABC transporter ATP-binding protein [Candidatus Dormibacteraeota bacterium]
MSTLREQVVFLWTRLRRQRPALVLLALLVAGGAAASLAGPVLLSQYINDTEVGLTTQITLAASLYLLTAFALPVLSVGESWLATLIAWRSTNQLRLELFRHCLEQDLDLLERQPPGALITRIDGDVDMLAEFLSTFVVRLVTSALILAGVLVVLARIDWRLGVLMAVFIVLCAVALQAPRGPAQRLWHAHRSASADEFGTAEELLGGTDDVRANGATGWAIETYVRRGWATYTAGRRAQFLASASWASAQILYGWATAACLVVATWLFDRHALTVGTVYLVFAYAGAIQTPLQAVSRQLQLLQTAGAALARTRELLAERPRVSWPEVSRPVPEGPVEIRVESVGYRYPDSAETLRDVSFRVAPGRRVGVVGRTGSGKTTVARLLLRFQDPDRGAVRLNGVDLRQAGRDQLRRLVAYVPQEVQLLHASVRDNLTLFGRSASDRRLLEVLDSVGLSDWLASLPQGLDTPLAPGGRDLSAGQAQLLAAARAFLVDPGLLVLDEASSRIDPATERRLQAAFDRLFEGRTAFIIAHRLATVRHVDDILVLDRGRVVEFGPREELEGDPGSRFAAILRGER